MNILTLPRVITAAELEKLAAPGETLAVRLIIRRVPNSGAYTLHGKKRDYVLTKHHAANAHHLDIPLSVWMAGSPVDTCYVDNLSVCSDIQDKPRGMKQPIVTQIVPWKGAKAQPAAMPVAEQARPLAALRDLAATFGAPEMILAAIDLVASPMNPAEVELKLRDIQQEAEEAFRQQEAVEAIEAERLEEVANEFPDAARPEAVPQSEDSHSASPPSAASSTVEVPASTPAPKAKSANAERQARHRAKKKAEKEAKKQNPSD